MLTAAINGIITYCVNKVLIRSEKLALAAVKNGASKNQEKELEKNAR
jgi:hypothetical protein